MSVRNITLAVLLIGLSSAVVPSRLNAQGLPPLLRDSTAKFSWSSYLQLRYTSVEGDQDLYALRRFKLMLGGHLAPKIQWYAQGLYKDGNNSPTDGRGYLQEVWLRFAFRKDFRIVLGQFKPPFGRERFTPDYQILTPERSLMTDTLTPDGPYSDSYGRDRGVQVDGELSHGFRYAAGIFDGRGANHHFHGIGPMVVGQIVKEMPLKKSIWKRQLRIQLGAATAFRWGDDLPFRSCCTGAQWSDMQHFRGADRRWGAEFSADCGDISLRAEYIRAHLRFSLHPERDFATSGWYLQAAKYLMPSLQAVIKLEQLDPNDREYNSKDIGQTTLGLNYYIRQNRLKLMTAYVLRSEAVHPAINNLFQLQFQWFLH